MAKKKIWLPQEIYQLKVTLLDTRPPIWRRLLVPAGLTLEVLHDVLQLAMGWTDSHLHEFRVGPKRFGVPDPEDQLMGLPEVSNERSAHLFKVLYSQSRVAPSIRLRMDPNYRAANSDAGSLGFLRSGWREMWALAP